MQNQKIDSMHKDAIITSTNYFHRVRPWVKRVILFSLISFAVIWRYIGSEEWLLGCAFVVLVFFIAFSIPIDDLAVSREHFHHIRKSPVPFFSKVTRYELSEIKSVSCKGTYSLENDLLAFISFGQLYQSVNWVEITFNDSSSMNFRVAIFRKDLDAIVNTLKGLI